MNYDWYNDMVIFCCGHHKDDFKVVHSMHFLDHGTQFSFHQPSAHY